MKIAALTAFAMTLVLISGCAAVADTASDAKAMMAKKASGGDSIADTKASLKKAEKAGCAWRDTGKMLKKAEKFAGEGKKDKANAAAASAMRQIENGLKQCESEAARLKNSG